MAETDRTQAGADPQRLELTVSALEHGAMFNPRHPVVLKALGLEMHMQPLTQAVDMYDFLLDEWIPMPRGDVRLRPGEGLILKRQQVDSARNLHQYIESTLPLCLRQGSSKVPSFIARRQETVRPGRPRRSSGWTAGMRTSMVDEDERERDSDCEILS